MIITNFKKLSQDEQERIKIDIQSLYLHYIPDCSPGLTIQRVIRETRYSKAIVKHCVFGDEAFKAELLALRNKRNRLISASITSNCVDRIKVQIY